jgi:hypothetical protein
MRTIYIEENVLSEELNNIEEYVTEYKRILALKRELEIKENLYKNRLLKEFSKHQEKQEIGNYYVWTTKTKRKSFDQNWLKQHLKDSGTTPLMIETESIRLNVRRRLE